LGTSARGETECFAFAINDQGTAIGYGSKFDAGGNDLGYRAIRWDPSSTTAVELGDLGDDAAGISDSRATAINAAGAIVGEAAKYDGLNQYVGPRAVRWDPSSTLAVELGNLGTDASGTTASHANDVNDAGTTVGRADKYDSDGVRQGERAVRWDANTTTATELGLFDVDPTSSCYSEARAINAAGTAVGSVSAYDAQGHLLFNRATYWGQDGVAVDLNSLIDPASGWSMTDARAISDSGWIAGLGQFDPDGAGPLAPYSRLFLMNVPATAPEPGTACLVGMVIVVFSTRQPIRSTARSARKGRDGNANAFV
jgi:uncharacterized membrane protein